MCVRYSTWVVPIPARLSRPTRPTMKIAKLAWLYVDRQDRHDRLKWSRLRTSNDIIDMMLLPGFTCLHFVQPPRSLFAISLTNRIASWERLPRTYATQIRSRLATNLPTHSSSADSKCRSITTQSPIHCTQELKSKTPPRPQATQFDSIRAYSTLLCPAL